MVRINLTEPRSQAIRQGLDDFNRTRIGYYQLDHRQWLWRYWHCHLTSWNLDTSGYLDFVDDKKAMEFVLRYG